MIGTSFESQHVALTRGAILDIYGLENIEAAFITGSIPAGTSRPNSDVDIFVCHNDAVDTPDEKRAEFTDFYFDLHRQLDREPDPISPGEILTLSGLFNAVSRISRVLPAETLLDRNDFDAICFAGMLVSKKEILIPSTRKVDILERCSLEIVTDWAAYLAPDQVLTHETGGSSDADKILRRTISCPGYYDAH